MIFLASFLLGTCIGSFLNVCIYRIPAGESIVRPASRCPGCRQRHPLVPEYPDPQLAGPARPLRRLRGAHFPSLSAGGGVDRCAVRSGLFHFGFQWATPVYWLFMAALVAITFIDLDHQIIPDVISLPGIPIGFACSFLVPWITWSESLIGILAGGGSLYLVAAGYELLTKKEGMGGGDIKLLAMIGAFLGWQAVLPVIFFSSLIGSLVGVPIMLAKKADGRLAIPFGPFLALGAVIYLLWGRQLVLWYLSLF